MADDSEWYLENWARWARDRWFTPSMCKSLESHYRSPQVWHPPEARPPEVVISDALKVEKAVTALLNSENRSMKKYGIILVGHYVKNKDPRKIALHAKIRFDDLDAMFKAARLHVLNRLRSM